MKDKIVFVDRNYTKNKKILVIHNFEIFTNNPVEKTVEK
tara:strand:- start:4 stop:120 length:117 start_codon:yes stop_codon:yes gene_type:complete